LGPVSFSKAVSRERAGSGPALELHSRGLRIHSGGIVKVCGVTGMASRVKVEGEKKKRGG